jgi:hypothetical protein
MEPVRLSVFCSILACDVSAYDIGDRCNDKHLTYRLLPTKPSLLAEFWLSK